jgi:hypothetical protein
MHKPETAKSGGEPWTASSVCQVFVNLAMVVLAIAFLHRNFMANVSCFSVMVKVG